MSNNMPPREAAHFKQDPWITRPEVPDDVYTNRTEFLDYFYRAALNAANRRTMSIVLLGQRRMGKTEIFRRVVNRLFFEQDPTDPKAVVPVYYSFPDEVKDRWEFSEKYLENFIRHYIAFYAQDPQIISEGIRRIELQDLMNDSKKTHPYPRMLEYLHKWYDYILRKDMATPEEFVVQIPRKISDIEESTIVMFLDEFQNVRLPLDGFSVAGYMQHAVESNTCPHFVTGSTMSILANEIIGRGSLFGRFWSKPIKKLSAYWGTELVKRSAVSYGATVSELMAPVVAERCGGNPFYISAVVRQSVEIERPLVDEDALSTVLAVDLSSGFIWAELYEQVIRWIERINEQSITKWVLYLSTFGEGDEINPDYIQEELRRREGKEVPIEEIREVLIRLSRGDLLEHSGIGYWFRKIDDPILLEFLKVWGQVYVEGQHQGRVHNELSNRYQRMARRFHEYKGYLAEVFMSQVLLNNQNRSKKPFPGHFFNSDDDITLDTVLFYLHHRVSLGSGKNKEVDIIAAFGDGMWVCQSKWETTRRTGIETLHILIEQTQLVEEMFDPLSTQMWLFAHEGLTDDAEELARAEGIYWSTREQLDGLLQYLDLRPLPDLDDDM